jgi:predicted RNase H-like nuclease (RuvC/YqgF family)
MAFNPEAACKALDSRISKLESTISTLEKSVAALEKRKPVVDSDLESFKKMFNSFTKDMRDVEAHYNAESKELHTALATVEKHVQELGKTVKTKVIETQGGGI